MQERFPRKRSLASLLVVVIVIAIIAESDIISWGGVAESLQEIGWQSFLVALCLAIVQYVFVALRFIVLLARESISPFQICRIFTNGQLFNHLFPARAGDLYKVLALKRESGDALFSTAHVVSALILERAISTMVLILFIVTLTDWSTIGVADLTFVDRGRQLQIGLFITGLALLALYFAQKRFPRLRAWLRELKRGFMIILDLRKFVLVVCLSVAMWTLEVLSMKFVAAPLGIDLQLGQGLFVLLLLNLGIAVPITLGNIGTYEAALVLGLGLWGIGANDGVAIAISHHFLQIGALVLLAGLFNGINLISSRNRSPATSRS
ncbi:lysylphosphatidylglycerol synthase transmembrane domain-containing protein [Pseudomonadota bacterium]